METEYEKFITFFVADEILVYYSNEFEEDIILSPIIDTEKIEQGYIRFTYEKPSPDEQ